MKVHSDTFKQVLPDMKEGDIIQVEGSKDGSFDGYWKLGKIEHDLNPDLSKPTKWEIFIYKIKRTWRRIWSKSSLIYGKR